MDLVTACHIKGLVGHTLYNLMPRDPIPLPKASKAILLGIMGHGKSFY